jgi:hypothetical protein
MTIKSVIRALKNGKYDDEKNIVDTWVAMLADGQYNVHKKEVGEVLGNFLDEHPLFKLCSTADFVKTIELFRSN